MNHTRLWAAAAIIALVIGVGFAFSVPHTRDLKEAVVMLAAPVVPVVALRDSFKKGVHTISGSIEAPNACTSVNAEAHFTSTASTTGRILVTISTLDESGVCLQLPTRIPFQTSVTAPARTPIDVTVNGSVATTSIP